HKQCKIKMICKYFFISSSFNIVSKAVVTINNIHIEIVTNIGNGDCSIKIETRGIIQYVRWIVGNFDTLSLKVN
ncbi:hypothetical protein BU585_01695, partial [Staphylococcus agnetis]